MFKKYLSAIFIVIALFLFTGTSQSQVNFGLYVGNGPRYHTHYHSTPYYYPGYVYHRPHYQRIYHPQRRFYYRHDNGRHKGWYKKHGHHKR